MFSFGNQNHLVIHVVEKHSAQIWLIAFLSSKVHRGQERLSLNIQAVFHKRVRKLHPCQGPAHLGPGMSLDSWKISHWGNGTHKPLKRAQLYLLPPESPHDRGLPVVWHSLLRLTGEVAVPVTQLWATAGPSSVLGEELSREKWMFANITAICHQ